MRILITGARSPACLEWARLAKRAGAEAVFVGDSLAVPLARFSSAATGYVRLPSARADANAYGKALCEVVEQHRIDVILPTCEEAFYISHQKARLEKQGGCRVIVPDFPWMARLHNKYDFRLWAAETLAGRSHRSSGGGGGIGADRKSKVFSPITHLITSVQDAEQLSAELTMSGRASNQFWVLKPVWSRFAVDAMIIKDNNIAGLCRDRRRPEAIARNVRNDPRAPRYVPTSAAPWVAQRFVVGKGELQLQPLREGRVLAHTCYRPLYRAGTGNQGSGIYFQPREAPAIAEFVRAFGAATGITGQVAFDFIEQSGVGGRVAVLECNPRATSGIHLLADALDDAAARQLLRAFLLGEAEAGKCEKKGRKRDLEETAPDPSPKPAMLGAAMLLFAAPSVLARSLGDKTSRPRFMARWAAARDVTWTKGDRVPALGQLLGFGEFAWMAMRRRQSLLAATTADIEWNGEDLGIAPD